MVGRIDPERNYGDSTNYVYTIGEDKLSSDLQPISDSINNKFSNLELDRKYNDLKDLNRFYYRSDHYNFANMVYRSSFISTVHMQIITDQQTRLIRSIL